MNEVPNVIELARTGRYADALEILQHIRLTRDLRLTAEVLRVELLERTGAYSASRALACDLLANPSLPHDFRSRCEVSLGLVESDEGKTSEAISHFQKAISHAQIAKDPKLECLSQLRLFVLLADSGGHIAAIPVVAQARSTATKVGDPYVSAALHVLMGQIDAKRGLINSAVRHTSLGRRLLGENRNLWLEAVAENTLAAIAFMRSEFQRGITYGENALRLARESGAAAMQRAAAANLGNLHYQLGEFDQALSCFATARELLPKTGESHNGGLDSLALVCLAQGHLQDAADFIATIDASVVNSEEWLRYGNRHSRLTKAIVLLLGGRYSEASYAAQTAVDLAVKAGDQLLATSGLLVRADAFLHMDRHEQAFAALSLLTASLADEAPHTFADYHRVLACALRRTGNVTAAEVHLNIARRVYKALRSVPSEIHLTRAWTDAQAAAPQPQAVIDTPEDVRARTAREVLHNVAALLLHADRPELVATGIVSLMECTKSVSAATVARRNEGGTTETLATVGVLRHSAATKLLAGLSEARQCEVMFESRADIESAATINTLTLLLNRVRDLERAQAEREERLTLWPLDELPLDDDRTVVNGKMREVMTFARRIAGTNVSVLITGESGTGKEILARAIHGYSPRPGKPFVPFNCTAVPRELLESHLFGYRRGAFTGAERDHPGLIRAARDGTLFLDEIGELGVDLQPKLLRFLESGEIHPLGEPGPFTVNVRIIAATNANLEQLVSEGRFREDLFYRLNVIRLTIPPLRERRDEIPALVHHFVARAAGEFGKGRVRVAEETMEQLLLYHWPGNVRQLQNELRRMVALAEADAVLEAHTLSIPIQRALPHTPPAGSGELAVTLGDKLQPTINKIEREMIKVALRTHQGRMDAAARALGISRKGLYLKRQRLGL